MIPITFISKTQIQFRKPAVAQIRLYVQLITSCTTRYVAVVEVDKIAHVGRVANRL